MKIGVISCGKQTLTTVKLPSTSQAASRKSVNASDLKERVSQTVTNISTRVQGSFCPSLWIRLHFQNCEQCCEYNKMVAYICILCKGCRWEKGKSTFGDDWIADKVTNLSTYKKNVWVVGNAQFLLINSVVVTLVQVIHNERIWPDRRQRMKRRFQRLMNLLRRLDLNAEKEL